MPGRLHPVAAPPSHPIPGVRLMQCKLNRRQALTRLASAGVAALALRGAPAFTRTRSPNTKLSLAVVGCGGRGTENLQHVSGENIVALCDVDEARATDA